jgi:hypothetical protein
VKGNLLRLKLLHFTERLLNEYLDMKIKGQVMIPKELLPTNKRVFLSSELD